MRSLAFLLMTLPFAAGCLGVENSLVYHPRPAPVPYEAPPLPIQDVALKLADGTEIHARWAPRLESSSGSAVRGGQQSPSPLGGEGPGVRGQPVILFCHGNGGNIEGRGREVREMFQQTGASVLIFDYPGYGRSGGSPSEAGCYAAAEAAYRWLTDEQHVSPERILLWGESLGGAVAVELASRRPHRALVLVRTFTSLPDVGEDQLPILPCSYLMTNRFDSLARIPLCKSPIFIANSDDDRLIELRHGERLRAACQAPSRLFILHGLGHNDPLPSAFYDALRGFLAAKAPVQ